MGAGNSTIAAAVEEEKESQALIRSATELVLNHPNISKSLSRMLNYTLDLVDNSKTTAVSSAIFSTIWAIIVFVYLGLIVSEILYFFNILPTSATRKGESPAATA